MSIDLYLKMSINLQMTKWKILLNSSLCASISFCQAFANEGRFSAVIYIAMELINQTPIL